MEQLSIAEILEATAGQIYVDGGNYQYDSIGIDTRKLSGNSIFVAVKGDNFNGNDFASDAAKKGALICIVDEIKFEKEQIPEGATIIKVQDGRVALKDLAKYYRSKLDIKIIGVTGSTGKTSTKDLVAAVLGSRYKVFKTKGNFNNEIGLPLMIFNLDSSYDAAVLEMGMSNLNEIHNLADIARPDIAIITNVGISHIENLKSRENILKAKMEITDFFGEDNILIINAENDLLSTVKSDKYRVVKIGFNEQYDYCAENIVLSEDNINFELRERGTSYLKQIDAPVIGKHNVLNSLLAAACGRIMGLSLEEIDNGIKGLEATSMRLDIVRCQDFTIIDDSYNASPDSMKAALDVLSQMKGNKRIAVLGTMRELGDMSFDAHKDVGKYAALKDIDLLMTMGDYNEAFRTGFGNYEKHRMFNSIDEILEYLPGVLKNGDLILVKASRSMRFEAIVQGLKAMANEGGKILH